MVEVALISATVTLGDDVTQVVVETQTAPLIIETPTSSIGGGGGGGAAVWGGITGTITDQGDLQVALAAKADDTDLANYSLTTHNHNGVYQPANTFLTNLAGSAGAGFVIRAADGTVSTDTNTYSLTGHNHDAAYSAIGHNHDAAYQAKSTFLTNLAGSAGAGFLVRAADGTVSTDTNAYSLTSHNHDAAYSAIGHNHDAAYQAKNTNLTLLSGLTLTGNANMVVKVNATADGFVLAADNTGSGGGGLTDGDYGDIIVGGTGTTMTIDAGTVTLAKMANLAANSIIGNNTGVAATPIALTAAQVKTLLAIGTADVSGLGTVATLASDTDINLTANSDVKVATQKAVKAYIDNAVTSAMKFKGSIDASTNPNYPAATIGDSYVISVAGKIGGASGTTVEIGDIIVATATNAGGTEATVGASWDTLQHNLVGALLSANNLSDIANAATARANLGAAASGAITASGLTMTTGNLLGRVTAANGAIEHITPDATLSMVAGAIGVAKVPNALTFATTGGSAAGAYDGSAAKTVDYSTVGAAPKSPQIQAVASNATVTPTFANDQVNITALAVALTLANWTGTAVDGWGIAIRIKDNGTAQTIAYGTQYRAVGVTLPTTTVAGKTLYLGCIWNAADSKIDVVAVAQE